MRADERQPLTPVELAVTDREWQPETTNVAATTDSAHIVRADRRIQGRPAWRVLPDPDRDWYAAVDELIDRQAVMVFTRWPKVDGRGTPVFEDRDYEFPVDVEQAQDVIDRWRQSHGQVARPLRIGDTFLIETVLTDPPTDLTHWGLVIDITDAARDQAKIAQYSALGRGDANGGPSLDDTDPDLDPTDADSTTPQPGVASTFHDESPVSAPNERLQVRRVTYDGPKGPAAAPPVI